jgi:hypothetical protein
MYKKFAVATATPTVAVGHHFLKKMMAYGHWCCHHFLVEDGRTNKPQRLINI